MTPRNTDSTDVVTAEPGTANAVVIINHFKPAAGTLFQTVTKRVTVSDGRLTLSPDRRHQHQDRLRRRRPGAAAGRHHPADRVASASPAPWSAPAPTPVTSPRRSPPLTTRQGTGVKTVTYSLDGGADTPYVNPFTVTGVGSHTIVVTATDNSNNVGTATKTFTLQAAPPPDTTAPPASVSLAGTSDGTAATSAT